MGVLVVQESTWALGTEVRKMMNSNEKGERAFAGIKTKYILSNTEERALCDNF